MRVWSIAVVLALTGCALAVPTPTPPPRPPVLVTPSAALGAPLPQPTIGDAMVVDSPEWPVIGWLRGWRQQDFGAMAVTAGQVGDAKAPAAATFSSQYDFRPLRGAEIVTVEQRGPSIARVTVRVWYEFPPGRVQRKRLGLMVERTDAPVSAATGVSPWRVNAASAAAETDDP